MSNYNLYDIDVKMSNILKFTNFINKLDGMK